ncbi:MAG: phage tail tape measure protein [Anaerovoracaceae bacterium]|jgi:hypothetical protein
MAQTNMVVSIILQAKDQASAAIKQAGAAARSSLGGLQGRIDAGNAAVGKFNERWGAALQTTRMVGVGMTAVGGGIVGGLMAMTKQAATYGDEIAKASKKTGIATEDISRLRYAAERSGVGFGGLESALARMARSASEAAGGAEMYSEAYDRLGVSVTDANGELKGGEQLFREVAEGLKNVDNATERAALAQEIFGRSGAQLLPLLNEGEAGIKKLGDRAEELGMVLSGKAAKDSERFNDALADLKDTGTTIAMTLGQTLMPTIAEIAEKVSEAVGRWREWSEAHPTLNALVIKGALALGLFMTFVGPLLVALPTVLNLLVWLQGASGFAGLAGAASSATPVLAGVGTTITGTILPALSGLATTIMGGVTTALSGIASLVTGTVIPAVMALGPALLAALPYVAIAAAIGFIIYALWRLKGEYDSAAEAAERANESFRELEAMENRAVAEGKADADILAAQKAEREAAPVTFSDRFWGAMTGGGRTSRDIARDRVAAGQESAAFATMRRRAEAREQNITVNVQGNVIGDVDIERKVSEGVSRANRQAAAAQ